MPLRSASFARPLPRSLPPLLLAAAAVVLPAQQPPAPAASAPVQPPAAGAAASSAKPPQPPQTPQTVSLADQRHARDLYLSGARHLEHNDLLNAQTTFEQAAKLDPNTVDYVIAARLALEHRVTELVQRAGAANLQGHTAEATTLLAQANSLDPQNALVRQHDLPNTTPPENPLQILPPGADPGELYPVPALAGIIHLQPSPDRHTFHLRGDLRTVARQVFNAYGIQSSFDDSIDNAATPQGVRFDLENVTFAEASPILLGMGRLFFTPLSPKSVLFARDTAADRTRLEHLYQETIYTPGLSPQQLGEVTNVIRQVFDVKQLSMQNNAGNITLRAPASTLAALNRTLLDLLDGAAEINLDLRLYSVDTSRNLGYGATIPQQFGVYNVAGAAQSLVSANQSAVNQAISSGLLTLSGNATQDLLTEALFLVQSGIASSSLLTDTIGFFGKGLTLSGVTAGGGAFTLSLNTSDSRALDDVQVRASDRQTATFRAGTRYPITTSTYSTGLSGTSAAGLAGATINGVSVASLLNQYVGSSAAGTTIPQIQYEDLGLTLKATPNVQSSGNISLHLDLKIEALTGQSLNNIPVLTSRQVASDVTVADGATALLLSTLSSSETRAVSGIPGLSELPGFQQLTANNTVSRTTSELVLLLTPRIVRRRQNLIVGPRIPISPEPGSPE